MEEGVFVSPYLVSMMLRLQASKYDWQSIAEPKNMAALEPCLFKLVEEQTKLQSALHRHISRIKQRQAKTLSTQSIWKSYQGAIDETSIEHFFSMPQMNRQLSLVTTQLERYIQQRKILSQLPEKLVSAYLRTSFSLVITEAGRLDIAYLSQIKANAAFLSHDTFSSIVKSRRVLKRYQEKQYPELHDSLQTAFSWAMMILRCIFMPWSYLSKDTVSLFSARDELKHGYQQRLVKTVSLSKQALNCNLDNFIHRWLVCTSVSQYKQLSEYEKGHIQLFLQEPDVMDALLNHPLLPKKIKRLLRLSPLEAFETMILINHQKRIAEENHQLTLSDVAKTVEDEVELPLNNISERLEQLCRYGKAFYDKREAKQLFGLKQSLIEGALANLKASNIFYSKSKRLTQLTRYRGYLTNVLTQLRNISQVLKTQKPGAISAEQYQSIELVKQNIFVTFNQNLGLLQSTRDGLVLIDIIQDIQDALHFNVSSVASNDEVEEALFSRLLLT